MVSNVSLGSKRPEIKDEQTVPQAEQAVNGEQRSRIGQKIVARLDRCRLERLAKREGNKKGFLGRKSLTKKRLVKLT